MFYNEEELKQMRYAHEEKMSLIVIDLLSEFIDARNDNERFQQVYYEIMRPISFPYLVKYEAQQAGLDVMKYCVQRLKKIGVKGVLISRIKTL